ncbi:hypothetical protein DY969_26005 [Pseudomonas aeruginosa]|nr:hypothetical protein DY969_26005 [Pseudomonas aeruginosa]RTV53077.1 hypothetical protein DY989_21535 [Pseudomonas aeruginosa]
MEYQVSYPADMPVAQLTVPASMERPPELVELQSLRGQKDDVSNALEGEGGLRYKAIRQEGLRIGALAGLAQRYGMIMKYLDATESKLNVTFSFNGFVRDSRLLIPAVIETPNQFIRDPETGKVTEVRQQITIGEEARVVSVVPTWRDYLYQEYGMPERPHSSMLPRTDAEVKAWEDALSTGWKAGVSQADDIYNDRLAQLTMAVEGRHLYQTLEQKHLMSPAALKVESNQVTFNGRTMNVGEIIYTIGNDTNFTPSSSWRPVWSR